MSGRRLLSDIDSEFLENISLRTGRRLYSFGIKPFFTQWLAQPESHVLT